MSAVEDNLVLTQLRNLRKSVEESSTRTENIDSRLGRFERGVTESIGYLVKQNGLIIERLNAMESGISHINQRLDSVIEKNNSTELRIMKLDKEFYERTEMINEKLDRLLEK